MNYGWGPGRMSAAEDKTVLRRIGIRTVQEAKKGSFGDPSAAQVLLRRALFWAKVLKLNY